MPHVLPSTDPLRRETRAVRPWHGKGMGSGGAGGEERGEDRLDTVMQNKKKKEETK